VGTCQNRLKRLRVVDLDVSAWREVDIDVFGFFVLASGQFRWFFQKLRLCGQPGCIIKIYTKEMKRLNIRILPKTRMGKRSLIMMILIFVLFIVGSLLPWKPGYTGFEIVIQNPIQGIITILMLIMGIATFSMALISVIKNKERAVLAFLAMLSGLYSILGFIGSVVNIFFSHP
jgi:hypothetical protein